jgi:hypothetical protein
LETLFATFLNRTWDDLFGPAAVDGRISN